MEWWGRAPHRCHSSPALPWHCSMSRHCQGAAGGQPGGPQLPFSKNKTQRGQTSPRLEKAFVLTPPPHTVPSGHLRPLPSSAADALVAQMVAGCPSQSAPTHPYVPPGLGLSPASSTHTPAASSTRKPGPLPHKPITAQCWHCYIHGCSHTHTHTHTRTHTRALTTRAARARDGRKLAKPT